MVENRPGAGGNGAMQAAARSAPDGYTLVVAGQGPFALKPGAWLVCEEFDSLSLPADPARHPHECALKAQAAVQCVMAARGVNTRYGRDLAARMRAHGLVDIRANGRTALWQGGSAGAQRLASGPAWSGKVLRTRAL